MYRLLLKFTVFAFCVLLVSPQVHACKGPQFNHTLFFNDGVQQPFANYPAHPPSNADGILDLPPDAKVIAEIVFTGINEDAYFTTATANIVRVLKTSDAKVRQGEKIVMKFEVSSCGPSHKNGDTGIVATQIGTDIEGHLVLCPYSRRFFDGHIFPPYGSECDPDKIEAARQIKLAAENGDIKAQITLG